MHYEMPSALVNWRTKIKKPPHYRVYGGLLSIFIFAELY